MILRLRVVLGDGPSLMVLRLRVVLGDNFGASERVVLNDGFEASGGTRRHTLRRDVQI